MIFGGTKVSILRIAAALFLLVIAVYLWDSYSRARNYRIAEDFCAGIKPGTSLDELKSNAVTIRSSPVVDSNRSVVLVSVAGCYCGLTMQDGRSLYPVHAHCDE